MLMVHGNQSLCNHLAWSSGVPVILRPRKRSDSKESWQRKGYLKIFLISLSKALKVAAKLRTSRIVVEFSRLEEVLKMIGCGDS